MSKESKKPVGRPKTLPTETRNRTIRMSNTEYALVRTFLVAVRSGRATKITLPATKLDDGQF